MNDLELYPGVTLAEVVRQTELVYQDAVVPKLKAVKDSGATLKLTAFQKSHSGCRY